MIFEANLRDLADATLGRFFRVWLLRRTQERVLFGPFAGMNYLERAFASSFFPKLLGTYEKELHTIIFNLREFGFRRVIDIGSAEGYYAVGLALLLPDAEVLAFEMEDEGRQLTRRLAEKNEVSPRVQIFGKCEVAALNDVLRPNSPTLVVCDTEGYEEALLAPSKVPGLASTVILCETHDFLVPGVTERLRAAFERTHSIQVVSARKRQREDFPLAPPFWLKTFGTRALRWCLGERRGPDMKWLFCVPRNWPSVGNRSEKSLPER